MEIFLKIVAHAAAWTTAAAIGCFAAIVVMRVRQTRRTTRTASLETRYDLHIWKASIDPGAEFPDPSGGDRPLLRLILLRRMLRTGGNARAGLAKLYARLGYAAADLANARATEWWRRLDAWVALGIAGDPAATLKAAETSLRDDIEIVRIAAARAVRALQPAAAGPYLIPMLADSSRAVADRIARELALIAPRILKELETFALTSPDAAAVARVADVLGESRLPEAAGPLLRIVQHRDPEVRIRAVKALGDLGDRAAAGSLLPLLNDERWELRSQAARALGKLRFGDAAVMLTVLLDDPNWWVRNHAARALVRIGTPGMSALQHAAEGKPGFVRDTALQTLSLHSQNLLLDDL